MNRVVIVGGGITGLATAYYLVKAGIGALVLESADRPGGVIRTEHVGGYVIEAGPDSLLAAKPAAAELCRELGIELISAQTGRVYVLWAGRLHALPEGMLLTVPARIGPFLRSSLISPLGKLRAALDLLLPRGTGGDESLGAFVLRRLGREILERIAEPLMANIYLAEADRLSLQATFPRFIEMERRHRSLIFAARRLQRPEGLTFQAPKGGMGEIVDALAARTEVRCNERVLRVEPGLRVYTERSTIEADEVVIATPAHAAAAILTPMSATLAGLLRTIPYVGSTTVSLAFAGAQVPAGTGFVIPRHERRRIVACSWSSQKYAHRAPPGHLLLRCFMTGEGSIATARDEIWEILGIHEEPVVARAFSWPAANPIYEVGHAERIRRMQAQLPAGMHLAGSAFHGIGVPDCIRDARRVAELVAGRIRSASREPARGPA
jgi:oxygen-dependent protoporphyrinogen oxidase